VTLGEVGETIHFSGDLGRPNDLVQYPPEPPAAADWIVMESTYGNREHADDDPLAALRPIVARTLERKGVLLMPSFAVGRAQTLLVCLWRLFREGSVPEVPVFVDSPMATSATELYRRHHRLHRLDREEADAALGLPTFTVSVSESKKLSASKGPMIIISASGMATAGRVLHHLKAFAPYPENTLLIPGFQAPGTRGAAIAGGAEAVKIHGRNVPIRAEVAQVDVFSAHADQSDLLSWLRTAPLAPKKVFLVHGEPEPADALRRKIEDEIGFEAYVPEYGEVLPL
jgi:metallo-beta-lactamase family protein